MLIGDILWRQARMRPQKTAFICGGRHISYAATAEQALRLANALRGLGIRPGQRVAVLAGNCAEHAETVFAIAACGAVWVPLNFRLSPPELAFIVNDAECEAVIYTADLAASAAGLRDLASRVPHWI